MAINLATKYSKKLAEYFYHRSIFRDMGSKRYDFTGVKTLKIYNTLTVPMTDYTRSGLNRYGTPADVQDTVQELVMTQDKSFTAIIDKGDNTQQMGVKNAMAWLRKQMDLVAIPTADTYALGQFVRNAGIVSGIANAPTSQTIVSVLSTAMSAMNDKFVPHEGRRIFLREDMYGLLIESPQFSLGASARFAEKALGDGEVVRFMGAEIVPVPSSYFPTNCYALIMHRDSFAFPWQLNDSKVHIDPPGVSGHLIEGRMIYDGFVLQGVQDGVLALVAAGSKQAAPTITVSSGNATITSSGATQIKYTLDGSDPRYSETAQVYTAAVAAPAGTVVTAVAYGTFTSDLATKTA